MTCPSCEYNKERAARWRREAYRLGGTPLPEPEGGTMNKEDIIRMARESCDTDKVDAWHNDFWTLTQEELERFAALVAAAERDKYEAKFKQLEAIMQEREQQPNKPCCLEEREACAKVCENGWKSGIGAPYQGDVFANAIRARGNHE